MSILDSDDKWAWIRKRDGVKTGELKKNKGKDPCDKTEVKQLLQLFHLHTEACARRMSPQKAVYSKCIDTDPDLLNSDCEKFKSSSCDCMAKHQKLQDALSSPECAFVKDKFDRFMACAPLTPAPTSPSPSVTPTSAPLANPPPSHERAHGSPIAGKVSTLMRHP